MKPYRLLPMLLLSACGDDTAFDYSAVPDASHDVAPEGGTGGTAGDAGDEDVSTGGTGGTGGSAGIGGSAGDDAGDASDAPDDVSDAAEEPEAFWCDPTWEPSDNECVIDDEFGIFVAPSGTDGATCGSKAAPCKSVGQGMTRAKTTGKRLYACGDGGTYEESLSVGASLGGLTVYGGFHCSDWSYEPTAARSHVRPSDESPALVASGVNALDVRDFAFESRDASVPGGSSLAAQVVSSTGIVFRNSTFMAGNGAAGTDGTAGSGGETVPTVGAGQKGVDSTCGATTPNGGGAWLTPFTCAAGGTTLGGKGGTADYQLAGQPGQPGEPPTNVVTPGIGLGGPGGTSTNKAGQPGQIGSDGSPGANGTTAPAAGDISESGYDTADGSDGANGYPGQGGGGSGASWSAPTCVGPSGGAGGLGGCGGFAGTKGTGGGASIGLLVWGGGVQLEDCTVSSGTGGKGGDGGNGGGGSEGQVGAGGGFSTTGTMADAGKGGTGGNGGPGGSGSGGTGGPSYALVYQGAAPGQVGTVTLSPGNGGGAGVGGQATGGTKASDGAVGGSGQTYSVP